MSPLQSVQRRTGFETLEAKKLFAADLMAGAAAPMVDDVVAEFSPGDLTSVQVDPGDLASVQMSPADAAVEFSARVFDGTGGFSYAENLGGQEGEPFENHDHPNLDDGHTDNLLTGPQEGEPLIEESDLAASIAPDGCVDLADHVFEQYAEEIGAHNTQWDLLYAK